MVKFVYIGLRVYRGLRKQLRESVRSREERCGRLIGVRYRDAVVVYEATQESISRSGGHCVPGVAETERRLVELSRSVPGVSLLGDWHTHWFEDTPRPSKGDVESLRLVHERYEEYRSGYVLLLLAKGGAMSYVYSGEGLKPVPLITIGKAGVFRDEDLGIGSRHREFGKLLGKKVTIVGLGSGGSLLTYLLAEAGVGEFRLVDYDVLAPANVTRHIVGLRGVGLSKPHALAARIKDHNPFARVKTHVLKVGPETLDELNEIARGSDLVIASSDSHTVNLLVNDVAVSLGCPFVASYVGPGASYGNVVYVPGDGSSGCYRCMLQSYHVKPAEPPREVRDGYGLSSNTALHLDLLPTVYLAARTSVNVLLGVKPGFTLAYVDNSALTRGGREPVVLVTIPRVRGCLSCGGRG